MMEWVGWSYDESDSEGQVAKYEQSLYFLMLMLVCGIQATNRYLYIQS